MDNVLQTALAEAVNSLASFFGTTTESVMAHAPEFLAKYGWYDMLINLPVTAFLCVLIAALIYLIVLLFSGFEVEHPYLIGFTAFIICLLVGVGCQIAACVVAPEIVGAHAVLELLKNMG